MRTVHRSLSRRLLLPAIAAAALLTARSAEAQNPSPVSVSGVVYAQYNYAVGDTAAHSNNFNVTRAYLNVTGRFAGGIATRVTGDIYQNADGSHAYRLKYAYAAWTPEGSALTYKLGLIHTPWIDWEEGLWGYRMQGTIPVDRNGYMTSADFGAGVDGHFSGEQVNFQAGFYNGEGYSHTPGDQRKDVMARASVRLMPTNDGSKVGGLRLSGYGQYGKPTGGGTRQRLIGMLSYRSHQYTLAAEYLMARDSGTAATTLSGFACPADVLCKGHIVSAYGVANIPNTRVSIIGRLDLAQTASGNSATRTTRVIAGAAYQLAPNVRLLADYDALSYNSAYTPTAGQYAARQQALFQAQFSF